MAVILVGARIAGGVVTRTIAGAVAGCDTLTDGPGSTSELTDGAGAVTDAYTYDVFGALRSQAGATTEWSYAGEQVDATGLQYLRARYYDASTGRFAAVDPHGAAEPYAYVSNNPANLVDPSGLIGCGPFGGVCDKIGDVGECALNGGDCVDPRQLADPLVELLPERTVFEIGGHFQISVQLTATCFQYPEACGAAAAAAPVARGASFAFYGAAANLEGTIEHPKEGDAFEHCAWSGLTTLAVGAGRAERVTSRYEARADNPLDQKEYDISNNARGREFAEKLRANPSQGSSVGALIAYCRGGR